MAQPGPFRLLGGQLHDVPCRSFGRLTPDRQGIARRGKLTRAALLLRQAPAFHFLGMVDQFERCHSYSHNLILCRPSRNARDGAGLQWC